MSPLRIPMRCAEFEAQVSEFIDDALPTSACEQMRAHAAPCATCSALALDIAAIVRDAGVLPALTPSRDLWSGVEARLGTPVVAIGAASRGTARHLFSLRMLAAAAVLLATVSSGATYVLIHASATPTTDAPTELNAGGVSVAEVAKGDGPVAIVGPVAPTGALTSTPSLAAGSAASAAPGGRPMRYASNAGTMTERAYQREITAMRRIVDERLGDLDSATVVEIERNLRIIDKAIDDSRRALANDPRSRFLSTQLDRALESKLGVLRRIALL